MRLIKGYFIAFALLLVSSPGYAKLPIEEMKESTVRVICDSGYKGMGSGSGVIVGSGAHVITNRHVIECIDEGGALFVIRNKDEWQEASLLWSSAQKDLAILSLDYTSGGTVPVFATSDMVNDADTVYVLGFPGAADRSEDILFQVKTTKGIISLKTDLNGVGVYQTDASINFGNSGGPLFNEFGHLVGINFSKGAGESVEGIGYAIQIDEILPVLDKYSIAYTVVDSTGKVEAPTQVVPRGKAPEVRRTSPLDSEKSSLSVYVFLGVGILLGGLVFLLATRSKKKVLQRANRRSPKLNGQQNHRPVLYGISGPFAGKEFRLNNNSITFGRDPQQCQVVFPAMSRDVGRLHCKLHFDTSSGCFILVDQQSTNGTFLGNGQRLDPGAVCQMTNRARFYLSSIDNMFEVRLV